MTIFAFIGSSTFEVTIKALYCGYMFLPPETEDMDTETLYTNSAFHYMASVFVSIDLEINLQNFGLQFGKHYMKKL